VFGQGDLVNLKPNVADLEVEDLMSYLKTGNVSSKRYAPKPQPLRNPSPERLA
jgi:hypothetical protein